MSEPRLRINESVEVSPLDSSAAEPMVLCVVGAEDGPPRRYAIPGRIFDLLQRFDGRQDTEDVLRVYAAANGDGAGTDKLRQLVEAFLLPRCLLLPADAPTPQRPADGSAGYAARDSFLTIKVPLISGKRVQPIAEALAWLYGPAALAVALVLIVMAHVLFYGWIAPAAELDFVRVSGGDLLLMMALLTAITLVHEFGHATAAVRYGCRGPQIGWGLYIYFAVLYADVSEAWKLPRRQRAMVDAGGAYFQALANVALLALHAATGWELLLYAFLASNMVMATSLNPILRMDGYWLISDMFGIVNLREQSSRFVEAALARLARVPASRPVNLTRGASAALGLYSAASVFFFVFVLTAMVGWIGGGLVGSITPKLAELQGLWAAPDATILDIVMAAGEVLWRAVTLVGVGYFLYRMLRQLADLAVRLWGLFRRAVAARRPTAVAGLP